MTEVKGIVVPCPKCERRLLQMSFTGILLAPQATIMVLCGPCSLMVSLTAAFPDLFHVATREELLASTMPYAIQIPEGADGG